MPVPSRTSSRRGRPPRATAVRLAWRMLPPELRDAVAARCGAPIVDAVSAETGFTPGMASVLTAADGSRHFVKAASVRAQGEFAAAYRAEALVLARMPADVAIPRLRWTLGVSDLAGGREDRWEGEWVVLGIDHVDAAPPARPWNATDLVRCLDALHATALALTPAPWPAPTLAQDLGTLPDHWRYVLRTFALPHGREAAQLARGFAAATAGRTLIHTDMRDDNLLVNTEGVWSCDWNWAVQGAAWVDAVSLLLSAYADGHDVDAVVASHPIFLGVDPEDVDVLLATLTGYFLAAGDRPEAPTSPHLRAHQRASGEAAWEWLCHRRGWPPE